MAVSMLLIVTLAFIGITIGVVIIAFVAYTERSRRGRRSIAQTEADPTLESKSTRERSAMGNNNNTEPERGSALDLMDLEPPAYRVMQLILRKVEIAYPQLCDEIEALPEQERLNRPELDSILMKLMDENWLTTAESEGTTIYKAVLRRKSTNVLDTYAPKRRTGTILPQNVWDSLDTKTDLDKSSFQSDENS
jgi:hypothetical protein